MAEVVDGAPHHGPQVIFAMDARGRCTLSVGPGLAAHGLEQGELVGRDLSAVYSGPEDREAFERVLSGESFTTQRIVDGRLLRTFYQPVQGADGSLGGAVGVSTDVTEQVRAQEDLLKFKALADGSQDLIAIADEDGRATYVNPRASALQLPVSGKDLWSAAAELLGASETARMRARVSGGGRWSGDVVLRLPVGDTDVHAQAFPLFKADGGERLGTAWIAQDVTDLRASEAALRTMNADLTQFRALVDTSGDFIAIAALDGSVRYVNPAGRRLVGMPQDVDVTTTTIQDYLTPAGIERSERLEQPAVVEHGHWEGESSLRRTDGTSVPVAISSFLMYDVETNQPFALATVQRDITERLAVLRAQEEFTALVAHELRTPLTSVRGYVEIARESIEDHADPASVSAHLKVAARNIAPMERMVEQILRISGERRPRPNLRRPMDLVLVVQQAV